MTNGKQKGKRGELEICRELKEHGIEARRSQQYQGANDGEADIIGPYGLWCEVKRVEALNVYKAIHQAEDDANNNRLPTVFHRKNNEGWLVTMNLDDWASLYKAWVYQENLGGLREK